MAHLPQYKYPCAYSVRHHIVRLGLKSRIAVADIKVQQRETVPEDKKVEFSKETCPFTGSVAFSVCISLKKRQLAAVNGGWSSYGPWGQCSAPCGGGAQERSRTCTNPPPSGGGAQCVGPSKETQACNTHECPVNGGWSNWGDWGQCSASCGDGQHARSRTCTNPPPSGGGAQCSGDSQETRTCKNGPCNVNGGWSDWSDYGECNKTCGRGRKYKYRTCTNPPPSNGGKDCRGKARKGKKCKLASCRDKFVLELRDTHNRKNNSKIIDCLEERIKNIIEKDKTTNLLEIVVPMDRVTNVTWFLTGS
ncbi:coadhesin-like [Stylophora pistillata]|uniref:coadhesin-like n=1 Tax=Stylophora pistillata TaxID=50429 RepID=UPI000C05625C|nr:coadhesin-like [Stylophora pistillata]